MKKFITVISMQPSDKFNAVHYSAQEGDTLLENDIKTHYPILIAIRNTVIKREKIAVNIVVTDNCEYVPKNKDTFMEELNEARDEIGFEYELKEIHTSMKETSDKHLELFEDIIKSIDKDDELYTDVSYGEKPTPMVMMMVLNYAYDLCENTDIKAVIYGAKNHATGTTEVYDVTSLFYMNSVIQKLSSIKPADPLGFIRNVLEA